MFLLLAPSESFVTAIDFFLIADVYLLGEVLLSLLAKQFLHQLLGSEVRMTRRYDVHKYLFVLSPSV